MATAAGALPENVKNIDIAELDDDGLVCESRRRTGTRISSTACYSREEYAALQAAKREKAQRYIEDLAREQNMLGIQRQALEEQQRRSMMRAGQ